MIARAVLVAAATKRDTGIRHTIDAVLVSVAIVVGEPVDD